MTMTTKASMATKTKTVAEASEVEVAHAAAELEEGSGPELLHLAPDAVQLEENVRALPKLAEEFVSTIATQGVLAPVIAYRDLLGQIMVTDGQRRVLAAREVGLASIPVLIAGAPGSAEARVVGQLALNEAREPLTTAERAAAVQQLSLFGMEPSVVARLIGVKPAEVDELLRVAKSNAGVRLAREVPDLTITQAARVADIEASDVVSPEFVAQVEEEIAQDPEQADHVLARVRIEVADEEALQAAERDLDDRGVRHARRESFHYDYSKGASAWDGIQSAPGVDMTEEVALASPHVIVLLEAESGVAHQKVWIEDLKATGWRRSYEWRGKASKKDPSEKTPVERAERERAAAERRHTIEMNKQADAAMLVRKEYEAALLKETRVKGAVTFAAQAAMAWGTSYYDEFSLENPKDLLRLAGLLPDSVSVSAWVGESQANATRALLAAAFAKIETRMDRSFWRDTNAAGPRPGAAVMLLRWLAEHGYTLAPIEADYCKACEKSAATWRKRHHNG